VPPSPPHPSGSTADADGAAKGAGELTPVCLKLSERISSSIVVSLRGERAAWTDAPRVMAQNRREEETASSAIFTTPLYFKELYLSNKLMNKTNASFGLIFFPWRSGGEG
jgi:hypothetical protein